MLVIGVAGGTGSGKTTVVRKIAEQFREGEVAILSQDSYYFDNSHLQFIEPTKRFADIIIPQGGMNQVAINILTNHINHTLKNN